MLLLRKGLIMEVVFTQDVPNKARAGEVRRVPDGYARNYLLPQGLAEIATPEVLKRLHKIRAVGDAVRLRETTILTELQEALDGVQIAVRARITPTGRYYGAITSAHIAQELGSVTGREIERRWVEVAEPIREPGDYEITLRFSSDIAAAIQVDAGIEGLEDNRSDTAPPEVFTNADPNDFGEAVIEAPPEAADTDDAPSAADDAGGGEAASLPEEA